MCPAKTAEPTEMPFAGLTREGRNIVGGCPAYGKAFEVSATVYAANPQ